MPDPSALFALGVVLGAVSGFILALVRGNRLVESDAAEGERLRGELQTLQIRLRERAEAWELLPDLLRQMLAASGRRGAAPVVLNLVDRLLRPEQCAIFMTRPAQRRLALALGHGLPPDLLPGFEVEYGQGRLGHVAETRRAMDEDDFRGVSDLLKQQLRATEVPGLRAEVLAPVEDEGGLVGILCAGGAHPGPGDAKALLVMVAKITALALTQQSRLRATHESANLDDLTGVYCKRFFQRRLEEELQRPDRAPLSLLMIDLDHFKSYNDNSGHSEGDAALRQVGRILRGSVREDDMAARYGGQEFAVVYTGTTCAFALRLAEGIRHAVEGFPFPHRERQPAGALTISGGMAAFPDDAADAVDLIRAAARALAEAKASGRNRIREAAGARDRHP